MFRATSCTENENEKKVREICLSDDPYRPSITLWNFLCTSFQSGKVKCPPRRRRKKAEESGRKWVCEMWQKEKEIFCCTVTECKMQQFVATFLHPSSQDFLFFFIFALFPFFWGLAPLSSDVCLTKLKF